MKKTLCLLLTLLLALSLSAWAAADSVAFSPEGSVIFEKDGVKVTTAGLDQDPTDEEHLPIIWADIENSSDRDIQLGVTGGSVNGIMSDVVLVDFYKEGEQYSGADYSFDRRIPANSTVRCALSYYKRRVPGVNMDTLSRLEFCFTTAKDEFSWPDCASDPVVIETGETVEALDIASLGTLVLDSDELRLVIGPQDYDDWFGPMVYVYAENRTDSFLGLAAERAEADGAGCDYVYYGEAIAPGKLSAGFLCFEGDIQKLKGFENLTLSFSLRKADSMDKLDAARPEMQDTVKVSYPPQLWGEYENGGLRMEIQPKYNELVTVETHDNDKDGKLFTVSETASMEAGGHDGAGWLFSVGTVSEEKLHEMLCFDMSGAEVFAKDGSGRYYIYYHPTDVRYERASVEEMKRDAAQWSMLCEWAVGMQDKLRELNGLEYAAFGNSAVEMYLARAAWQDGVNATLSTTEFGPLDIAGVDAAPYAEFVMQGWFSYADSSETPDGEYVVLRFPDEDTRLDFFFAPGNYVRSVSGETENLYQAMWYDDEISYAQAMQDWYYAIAEKNGLREPGGRLSRFMPSAG